LAVGQESKSNTPKPFPLFDVYKINQYYKIMFGLFKKKSKKEVLQKKYEKLQKEAFDLSKTNRTLSDEKTAEAQKVLDEIEALS